MQTLKIALCQINPTVGDLQANALKMIDFATRASEQGAELILFPELSLSGYPPEDLVLKPHFLDECSRVVVQLCEKLPKSSVVIIGAPTASAGKALPHNSAVIISGGRNIATYHKILLPNYGVFDEQRVFSPGTRAVCMQHQAARIGIHICEDSWDIEGEGVQSLGSMHLSALMNISASPYHVGKRGVREAHLCATAKKLNTHLFYCNLVGGQDELVFDGASLMIGPDGTVLSRASSFEEELLILQIPASVYINPLEEQADFTAEWVFLDMPARGIGDLVIDDGPTHPIAPELDPLEEAYQALCLGVKDYVGKNGFEKVIVAISGGIDSALVAAIAVEALGKDRVVGISMPTEFSSSETRGDAELLAENLGIQFHEKPIQEIFELYKTQLAELFDGKPEDLTEENLQARIRGDLVMALSNKHGYLVLSTGNKSELATGYCTLYGDMCGGFAVIKDVPKLMVFDLCRHINARRGQEVIPVTTIDRPPSAELRADQKDSDSLPPYDVLDAILERYVELDQGALEIIAAGFDEEIVRRIIRLVDLNEYKRRQAPPGVRITSKAFGKDRRIPITNRFR